MPVTELLVALLIIKWSAVTNHKDKRQFHPQDCAVSKHLAWAGSGVSVTHPAVEGAVRLQVMRASCAGPGINEQTGGLVTWSRWCRSAIVFPSSPHPFLSFNCKSHNLSFAALTTSNCKAQRSSAQHCAAASGC